MEISKDALFVSDSHFSVLRNRDFETLLNKLEKSPPKQFFLLGDIFETLFGGVKYTENRNYRIVQKLENLAQKCEVFYFEGNHDFNLKPIFKFVKIIPISQQPFPATFKSKKVLLAHGDWKESFRYTIYRKTIENSFLLKLISFLDFGDQIIKNIEKKQVSKEKCREKKSFSNLIEKKISNIEFDILIEGHYHQGRKLKFGKKTYINLPPFLCKGETKLFSELI